MHLPPKQAEEELAAIERTMQKTRHSFSSSGSYIFLIYTGIIWLIGFLATQFLLEVEIGFEVGTPALQGELAAGFLLDVTAPVAALGDKGERFD